VPRHPRLGRHTSSAFPGWPGRNISPSVHVPTSPQPGGLVCHEVVNRLVDRSAGCQEQLLCTSLARLAKGLRHAQVPKAACVFVAACERTYATVVHTYSAFQASRIFQAQFEEQPPSGLEISAKARLPDELSVLCRQRAFRLLPCHAPSCATAREAIKRGHGEPAPFAGGAAPPSGA